MNVTIALATLVVVAVIFTTGATYAHHRGYIAGQNEREGHYAPLLREATLAKDAADRRSEDWLTAAKQTPTAWPVGKNGTHESRRPP